MKTGDIAPDFSLPTNGGREITLSDLRGQMVVVYFYPKDMTPGCTTEAQDFTALRDEFDALGVKIIGISKDPVKRHDKFIDQHHLRITLASDEEGKVCEAYGVWVLKKNYGREYMGIQRATFLIGPDGKILHIWPRVRVKHHAMDVLETARKYA